MKKLFFALVFFGITFSTSSSLLYPVQTALSSLCVGMSNLLPIAAMLMITFGSVVYAAGQLMGAETRARATVWATAALTGAIFAILIYSVTPAFLKLIYGPSLKCNI